MVSRHAGAGSVSTHWERLVLSGEGTETEVEYRVVGRFSPGHPGQSYGPPENCVPSEAAEVDFEGVFELVGKTEKPVDAKAFIESLTKAEMEELQARLLSAGEEYGSDLYDEAQERKYDEWKDRQYDD